MGCRAPMGARRLCLLMLITTALARHAAATALAQQHPKPQSAAESARQGADGSNSTVLQAGLVARTGSSRKLLQTNQFGYFIPADVCTAQLTLSGVVFYCIAPPQQLPAIVVIQRQPNLYQLTNGGGQCYQFVPSGSSASGTQMSLGASTACATASDDQTKKYTWFSIAQAATNEPYILSLPYLDVTQCVTSPSYSGYVLNNCNNNVWQLYWFIPVTSVIFETLRPPPSFPGYGNPPPPSPPPPTWWPTSSPPPPPGGVAPFERQWVYLLPASTCTVSAPPAIQRWYCTRPAYSPPVFWLVPRAYNTYQITDGSGRCYQFAPTGLPVPGTPLTKGTSQNCVNAYDDTTKATTWMVFGQSALAVFWISPQYLAPALCMTYNWPQGAYVLQNCQSQPQWQNFLVIPTQSVTFLDHNSPLPQSSPPPAPPGIIPPYVNTWIYILPRQLCTLNFNPTQAQWQCQYPPYAPAAVWLVARTPPNTYQITDGSGRCYTFNSGATGTPLTLGSSQQCASASDDTTRRTSWFLFTQPGAPFFLIDPQFQDPTMCVTYAGPQAVYVLAKCQAFQQAQSWALIPTNAVVWTGRK